MDTSKSGDVLYIVVECSLCVGREVLKESLRCYCTDLNVTTIFSVFGVGRNVFLLFYWCFIRMFYKRVHNIYLI